MKKHNFYLPILFGAIGMIGFQGCTDLTVEERDSVVFDFKGGGSNLDADATLATAYKDLSAFCDQAGVYALYEHPTDELMGPTRGTDWGDNGIWRSLHAHTWDATHGFVTSAWNDLNRRVYRCNEILASNPSASTAAQAKFLRAFNMWHVMDLYGQVPFRNVTDAFDSNPKVMNRAEAYAFIEKDLLEARDVLSAIGPTAANTTASRAAANAMLARLYLNAAVYKASNPEGPYTHDNGDLDKCIAACDAVTADGFTPEADYFANFQSGADNEIILTSLEGSGQNRIHMTLHYDHKPSGWNGFTTLSDFYNKFDANDPRRGKPAAKDGTPFSGLGYGFLEGLQYDDAGNKIKNTRNGLDLAYTPDVTLSGAATDKGIRCLKYHPFGTSNTDAQYPKYILLRYGDVLTMKAEAHMRKGDNAGALGVLNGLRTARGVPSMITTLDEQAMLDERGREMYWEGVRRTDLIRFGKFTDSRPTKPSAERFRVLFPIPQQAIDSNPNLSQNDGY